MKLKAVLQKRLTVALIVVNFFPFPPRLEAEGSSPSVDTVASEPGSSDARANPQLTPPKEIPHDPNFNTDPNYNPWTDEAPSNDP